MDLNPGKYGGLFIGGLVCVLSVLYYHGWIGATKSEAALMGFLCGSMILFVQLDRNVYYERFFTLEESIQSKGYQVIIRENTECEVEED